MCILARASIIALLCLMAKFRNRYISDCLTKRKIYAVKINKCTFLDRLRGEMCTANLCNYFQSCKLFQEVEDLSGDIFGGVTEFLVKYLIRCGCAETLQSVDVPFLGSKHQRIEAAG